MRDMYFEWFIVLREERLSSLLFIPDGNHSMKKNKRKISYEPEADVLRVELSSSPIDYAEELGFFVVHYTKKRIPVYVELIGASMFLKESHKAFLREGAFSPFRFTQPAFRTAR